ncbi:probable G-protein coupled receptor 139 [Rhincodon typus]|uniref:probable G-protein coupled receptor 139 n=1 Tax=Rhincodon typus TaxID=259920 RepID=UPI002030163D|nr:probable G-protein coupled receptor 139 [Rhincodon typus]
MIDYLIIRSHRQKCVSVVSRAATKHRGHVFGSALARLPVRVRTFSPCLQLKTAASDNLVVSERKCMEQPMVSSLQFAIPFLQLLVPLVAKPANDSSDTVNKSFPKHPDIKGHSNTPEGGLRQLTNLVAIIILSRGWCGLSRCVTYYLLVIGVSDFLVIITSVILNRIGRIYLRYSALSTTPGCTLSAVLVRCTRDSSVWLTVAFTIDRFVAICCQSLKTRYCTEQIALLVIGTIFVLSCIKNIPFYFIYQPLYIQDKVPWFCDVKVSFYTLPVWQAYHWLDHILTPFLPFLLILLLNALTVRHIFVASRARRRLRGALSREDSEMTNRNKSTVLLFTISLSFLCLWITYVGQFLYVRVTGVGYFTGLNFNDPLYIFQEMANMLQLLSSCNNVFIYAISQIRFREELKNMLMCPFTTITACIKQ